jgi:hypothetical protein
MAMIQFRCPICDGALTQSPGTVGLTIACAHCHSPIKVPSGGNNPIDRAARSFAPAAGRREPAGPAVPVIDRIGRLIGAHASEEAPRPLGVGKRIGSAFLGLFLTAIFGGIFVWVVLSFVQSRASQRWPSVQGKVLSAGVAEKVGRTSRGRRTVEYSAAVVYQYTVDGKEFSSSEMSFGPQQTYSFLAKKLANQYEEGQEVTVYYDPANPKTAVLRREVMFGGWVFGLAGLLVGFIGLRLLLLALVPTVGSRNSRWWPWSQRYTWVDLLLTIVGGIGVLLWVPMLLGV